MFTLCTRQFNSRSTYTSNPSDPEEEKAGRSTCGRNNRQEEERVEKDKAGRGNIGRRKDRKSKGLEEKKAG
jgi:hypothetical protein